MMHLDLIFLWPNSILDPVEIKTNSGVYRGGRFKSAKFSEACHTHDTVHAVRFRENPLQWTTAVTLYIMRN